MNSALTDLQLVQLRTAARRYLTDRCTVERENRVTGNYGEVSRTWESIAVEVPCRLVVARRTELSGAGIIGLRETVECVYRVALPPDTPIHIDDRLTIDGVSYGVVRLETALTDAIFIQAVVTKHG